MTDEREIDFDRAFMRNNPEGETVEAWFHSYGCRRWIRLRRDTTTDLILER
jgi:heterotetrameric sarcosine oxidase delta subunit